MDAGDQNGASGITDAAYRELSPLKIRDLIIQGFFESQKSVLTRARQSLDDNQGARK